MPVGSRITYTVNATIDLAATGTLSNTATIMPPPGVPDPGENNRATDEDILLDKRWHLSVEKRGSLMRDAAEYLGVVAGSKEATLAELVEALEGKRHRLASSPSVWPTKGWLTSRYGYRTSPFTGKRQFHAGLDIAGAEGTDIIAPARGKVVFSGKRGPLGKSLIIDHGYGVRTQYGHNAELFVKRGDEVERGQRIASLGNTGRSTGPHLHYVVEVKGKSRDPLDYILD